MHTLSHKHTYTSLPEFRVLLSLAVNDRLDVVGLLLVLLLLAEVGDYIVEIPTSEYIFRYILIYLN